MSMFQNLLNTEAESWDLFRKQYLPYENVTLDQHLGEGSE
jgi:hypothetical protein